MSPSYHSLLRRQIKVHLGEQGRLNPEIQSFIAAVNEAYREFDADRSVLERSLELSSQELLEANAHMQAVFHAFPDLFLWIDEQGVFIDCQGGGTAGAFFGLPEPMGRRIQDIPEAGVRSAMEAAVREVWRTREVASLEYRLPDSAGGRCCEVRLLTLAGNKILAIVRDITARKQAEERLRFHAQLLEGVRESIVASDMEGIIRYWSRGAEKLYGYSADEVMNKPYRQFAGAVAPPDEESFRREIVENGYWRGEHLQRHRNGTTFWTSTFISPFVDESGQLAGFIGMDQDITARKQAEEALQASEERFRQVAENAGEWIWEQNAEGLYTYSSPVVERILGFKPEELVGKMHFYDLFDPQVKEKIKKEAAGRSVRKESFWRLSNPVVHKDGHVVILETTGVPILGPDERLMGYRGTDTDITELKQAEEKQDKLQVQLNQAQKMESVGRLAGGVAHDFNNMLQAILGHVELALDQVPSDQPLRGDLLEIQKAAQRSADLTRQLLAFARKQAVAPKVVDLNETIEGMLKMLRRLIGENVDLVWHPGHSLRSLKMDPSQIDQILANLCVNARDAIGGVGSITIETDSCVFDEAFCAAHAGSVPGEYLRIAVTDNGEGMDKDTLSHIFEPFFTTKGIGQGTGLGLATVYGIVKQNNGFITVYSEPGEGSTFQIFLPPHQGAAVSGRSAGTAEPVACGNETILLVEDEPAILVISQSMLGRLGYRILGASTPREAIRLAEENAGKIGLLMTDVVMPEMNGRDLAQKVIAFQPGLKCLFMSGYTADVIAHNGMLHTGVHFLQKPFTMRELATHVRAALDS